MGGSVPKQFRMLGQQPVLAHTLTRFHAFDPDMGLVVVLHEGFFDVWHQHCEALRMPEHVIVAGGSERFFSVKNGLAHVPDEGIVGVHDAVRPFVSNGTLEACYAAADKHGAAVPTLPLSDSLREVNKAVSRAVDRSRFMAVQTPQCFRAEVLKKAYAIDYHASFTDDAAVVEHTGHSIALTPGNTENFKLTTPADWRYAEYLLSTHSDQ